MFVALRLFGGPLAVGELLSTCALPQAKCAEVVARLLARRVLDNLDQIGGRSAAGERPLDPDALDLPPERQRELVSLRERIRTNDARVILGVGASATAEEVKTIYFALAQRLHPDQYFRKRLGTFQGTIEPIFARVSQAFQQLHRELSDGPRPSITPLPAVLPPASGPPDADFPEMVSPDVAADAALPLGTPGAQALDAALPAPLADAGITGRPRHRFAKAMARKNCAAAAEALLGVQAEEPDALDIPKLRLELRRAWEDLSAKDSFLRGEQAETEKNWTEAFKHYARASSLDPRNPGYVERAARALLYVGDIKEAKRLAERAVELKPDDANAHATLGHAFLLGGLERNAKREFELALKLDPKHEFARAKIRKLWWKG